MKIIAIDNFARETVADRLIASDLDKKKGFIEVAALNKGVTEHDLWFYRLVEDDYRLSKGMEDLV